MTAPRRGRGRPALFNQAARDRYLAERRQGASQAKGAAAAGVAATTIRYTRRTDQEFRDLDDAAAAQGRAAHIATLPHDESRYVNYGCRCPACTADATAKRLARAAKERARSAAPEGREVPVVAIRQPDQGSSEPFSLARAS